ncbi:hypothetical protein [Corynebacterium pygosceleis]|uniref:hypothetical protein n=1 Tax=Corynebacterium pygosceleis TaxID=2800406 RepID=UPI0020068A45|nr:hypothetical protein [Corynebacterium pygosceleis]MCK7675720.1 hypothetical protein [Corynebacterium pygosceleis]
MRRLTYIQIVYLRLTCGGVIVHGSSVIKLIVTVVTAVVLGVSNISAASAQEVGGEEGSLVETALAAEKQAIQQGVSERAEVARPSKAEITDEGVTGDTYFGEISVSFGDSVKLEDVAWTEYAADVETGAVARSSSGVGTLIQTEVVAKHEDFVEKEWGLSMPKGVEAVVFDDGSVGFRMDTGNGVSAVSETVISAPWAVDEDGNPLETWYEISADGSSLRQIVDTQETEGEIVLDPQITYG